MPLIEMQNVKDQKKNLPVVSEKPKTTRTFSHNLTKILRKSNNHQDEYIARYTN